MSKYRRAPSGEWLAYPKPTPEQIDYESFRFTKYAGLSLVENRKGRVYLIMEHDFYEKFLDAVRRKFGNISAANVNNAALEAVKNWVEEVASK